MTDLHSCSFDIFGTQSGLTKDQSQSKPDDPLFTYVTAQVLEPSWHM
jgi:hypothetical protein